MGGPEEGKASHAEMPVCPAKHPAETSWGLACMRSWKNEEAGEGEAHTFFQQLLHLGTRAVIIDDHVKAQASEALVKSLGISVCSIPDAHTCGNPAAVHDEQCLAGHCVRHHPARHHGQLSDTLCRSQGQTAVLDS